VCGEESPNTHFPKFLESKTFRVTPGRRKPRGANRDACARKGRGSRPALFHKAGRESPRINSGICPSEARGETAKS